MSQQPARDPDDQDTLQTLRRDLREVLDVLRALANALATESRSTSYPIQVGSALLEAQLTLQKYEGPIHSDEPAPLTTPKPELNEAAGGNSTPIFRFRNHYTCPNCHATWHRLVEVSSNARCPMCNHDNVPPYNSVPLG